MPFPHAERVHYRKNPLRQVICQLRFPAILKIDAEIPAAFQERIRAQFPTHREIRRPAIDIPLPAAVTKMFADQLNAFSTPVTHQFESEDKRWSVSLCNAFIGLTDRKYTTWENFNEKLSSPLSALIAEYRPAYFTRVGLRYQNVIRRSEFGLNGVGWDQLLKPHISGELSSLDVAQEIQQAVRQVVMTLEFGKVQIQHGLALEPNQPGEQCFAIDADLYRDEKTEINDAQGILGKFSITAGNLFQWCITPRLHAAMEPEPLAALS
jgi:uncharacterized protein (TIGR04255 family)